MASVARDLVLLATGPAGVVRAARTSDDPHDAWRVKAHAMPHRVTCLGTGSSATGSGADMVYAGTDGGGVVRSNDGGLTWQAAGLDGHRLRSLAVSPQAPNTVYAGTKPAAIFASDDAGDTWRELTGFRRARRWYWYSPAEPGDPRAYVQSLAVSPTDPNALIAGMEAGAVVMSDDHGETWTDHRRHADRDCHTLTFHATDGNWVYQAGGGGPAVSRDGGRSWRHADIGRRGRYTWSCAADPARPEVWYVTGAPLFVMPRFWRMPIAHYPGEAHAAIYRSSGGGAWERLAGGLPQPLDHMAYGLATDPHRPGHVYAGLADGQVWHSADHGDNWSRLPVDLGSGLRSLAVAEPNPYS